MKIYLDDIRGTPQEWHRCFRIEEVKRHLCEALLGGEEITHMSLDHDLGASYLGLDYDELTAPYTPTGYDLVKWMAQHDMWPTNKPMVHSANPVGRANMQAVIDQYWHPPYVK